MTEQQKKTDNARGLINLCEENESTPLGIQVSWNVLCSTLKRICVEGWYGSCLCHISNASALNCLIIYLTL